MKPQTTRVEKAQQLLEQCETDLQKLYKIKKQLKKIDNNRSKLAAYYRDHYLDDYQQFANHSPSFRALDQDSIWNVIEEQYNAKLKLVKAIVKTL